MKKSLIGKRIIKRFKYLHYFPLIYVPIFTFIIVIKIVSFIAFTVTRTINIDVSIVFINNLCFKTIEFRNLALLFFGYPTSWQLLPWQPVRKLKWVTTTKITREKENSEQTRPCRRKISLPRILEKETVDCDIVRVSKTHWTGSRHLDSLEGSTRYFSGLEQLKRNGIALIVKGKMNNAVTGTRLSITESSRLASTRNRQT